ncbi:recombinase RecT [Paenibacillus ginsengarvi]|uniref:Recombinase n=1 Tax=Paenibacillus ginsengarvi TaxID=400777 RepID=A0A3B0BS34_9BACL|nr:recombinase RecT [Paenibacillus ginsengarvi]RKN75039.1 recombinase [Paenibacillus ginsengarvi]
MTQNAVVAAAPKKSIVDLVASKIHAFQERGEIHFPANYSPENALKSAWLTIQTVMDRNQKPALEVCTKDSVANALLDMAVQGLNPVKKQGYFIVYGKTLTFMRSYFGTMAVTKRVTGAQDIDPRLIFEGDDVDYEIRNGRVENLTHKTKFSNINNKSIIGAYCTISWADGRMFTEIMTWDEIQASWKKSKQNPDKEGSTHQEFPGEMAKRTVINRTCKAYMNTSDDGSLILKHFHHQDDVIAEAELEEEIAENANRERIDVTPAAEHVSQDTSGTQETKVGTKQGNQAPDKAREDTEKPSIDEMELNF